MSTRVWSVFAVVRAAIDFIPAIAAVQGQSLDPLL